MECRCTKCATLYHIGALEESFGSQVCPYCGAALEIKNNYRGSFACSSSFPTNEYKGDLIKTTPAAVPAGPSLASKGERASHVGH
jgi:hypothetical protein